MNYLTQYYKNLSEQLQARVNHLQEQIQLLNEIGDTPAGQETLMRYYSSASPSKRAAGRAQAAKRLGAHGEIEVEDYETAPDEAGGQIYRVKGRTQSGVPVEYETPRQFGIDVPTPKSGRLSPQELATLAFGNTPSPKNLTPNRFDGPDADMTGDTEEVVAGQRMADMIATHHANIAPHIPGRIGMDVAASKADILQHLTREGAEPITSKNFVKILKDMEEHGSFAPYSISAPSGEPDRAKYNKIIDDVRVSILDAMSEEA